MCVGFLDLGICQAARTVITSWQPSAYDPKTQIATVNLIQTIKPKALGGVLAITTHQRLKLQLESNESSNNGTLLIVEHSEVHLAQDLIKQMPIIGKWYEHGIRTAIGQLSMAGTSVLNATGILDLFPAAVRISTDTARGVKMKANAFANRALEVGVPALEATGVTPLVRDVYGLTNRAVGWATNTTKEAAQLTKSAAVKLIEDGRGENIDCYSPTCEPGKRCYSPTCPRGNTYELLSVDAVADIVKGAYQGVGRTTGLLTTHEES